MRWKLPWNRQSTPSKHPTATAESTSELPELALEPDALEARVSQLAADLAGLRLEWAEVLDKIKAWASRQAARERQRAVRELDGLAGGGPESREDALGDTNGGGDGVEVGPPASMAQRANLKAQLRARAAALNLRR